MGASARPHDSNIRARRNLALQKLTDTLAGGLAAFGSRAFDNQACQAGVRRIHEFPPAPGFVREKTGEVVPAGERQALVFRPIGLQEDLPRSLAAAGAAPPPGSIAETGARAPGSRESTGRRRPIPPPTSGDVGIIVPLGDHLGADQDVDVAFAPGRGEYARGRPWRGWYRGPYAPGVPPGIVRPEPIRPAGCPGPAAAMKRFRTLRRGSARPG